MVEKVRVAIATGEASKECWYLLTSLPPHRCSPGEMLRLFRSHWSIENNLHHVKDRSWDEDRHTLRRPGLGEVFATLVNVSLNSLRLACVWLAFGLRLACVWLAFGLRLACVWLAFGRMVSFRNVHAAASQDLCLPPGTDYRPALRTCNLTLQLS